MKHEETGVIILTVLLGLGSAVFSNSLWGKLGVTDPSVVTGLTSLLTVTVVLIGFLFAFLLSMKHLRSEISKSRDTWGDVEKFDGIEGLRIAARRLDRARKVLNTRIVFDGFQGELYTKETDFWNRAIIKNIQRRHLVFVDIVSGKGESPAAEVLSSLHSGKAVKGEYFAVVAPLLTYPVLNFKIFYYENQDDEVWFGWNVSESGRPDSACFRSQNKNLVRMFEELHGALHRAGEPKVPPGESEDPAGALPTSSQN